MSSVTMAERIFGHIPGYPVGSRFASRAELSKSGVHRPRVAGISGSGREGADSVVLAGGYEDGEDFGDVIFYTGHGGRDPDTKRQIGHQPLSRGNLALAQNRLHRLPVRLIRGAGFRSAYVPVVGDRYVGLYAVEDYWRGVGRAGFFIWRFRLVRMNADKLMESSDGYMIACETVHARQLKQLYHYRCQICGVRLEGSAGPYAEAVHIRPLEAPHNGPDSPENMLCLCPNCRVLFDIGGVTIADDFQLIGREGQLRVDFRHRLNLDHLSYRRLHYPLDPEEESRRSG